MQPVIYIDLRCLQDPAYQFRGIGYHTAALLRARRFSVLSGLKAIGLVNPQMPKLLPDFTGLVDETSSSVNPCCNNVAAVFIDGSPMTHDTRFSLRFQNHPGFLNAAVFYDFIPLDWPGYLPTVSKRVEYVSKVIRLRNFALFFPISEYTACRISAVVGVPRSRIHVTGACVRRSLYEAKSHLPSVGSLYDWNEPYFVTIGGDDRRKNTEVAVKAVGRLNLIHGRRIPLKVIGHYGDSYKRELLRLAGHIDGQDYLEFYPNISDEKLFSLHAGALAAIAPSHIEGFSLPVAEASVCGCPIVASTCAAHLELIEQTEALFPAHDAVLLSEKLDALLNQPDLRNSLVALQAHLGPKFHEHEVAKRFWTAIAAALDSGGRGANIERSRKPRLAFLSPYPPDHSLAARYTAMTLQASENLFQSDVYTDGLRPLTFEGNFRDAGEVSLAPIAKGDYDGVVSVLGNDSCHKRIFEVFERYGGPCILHDCQLAHAYFYRLGPERFLEFAAKLMGRSVSIDDVNVWLRDGNPPLLFLEPIIERASPLILHTITQQNLLKKKFGIDAHVINCCPTIFFGDDELTTCARQAARERHNIPRSAFLISSFGDPIQEKGMESGILAVEILHSWNIPAELHFVGTTGSQKEVVDRISRLYGIAEHVHCVPDSLADLAYRDFLLASDAAVQLRINGFGRLSTALTNCISAGLLCVANHDLAESCGALEYVSTVPDRFSPLHVAEQLASISETRAMNARNLHARAAYVETHNFEYYGKRLVEILGVA